MARRGFAGAAKPTTVVGSMTAVSPGAGDTFVLASSTGWAFTTMPFVVVVDRGLATEEKILCSAIAGATVTVGERGYNDTTAQIHGLGAPVLHVLDSLTVDEANQHSSSAHTYVHVQLSPLATWTVVHNLGFFPAVTIVDSGGNVVIGDIVHVDSNSLTASFNGAFSGKAYAS